MNKEVLMLILAVVVILVAIGLLILTHKNARVRKIAYDLVEEAENAIDGRKQGKLKYQYVIDKLDPFVPVYLRWYFTDARIDGFIEDGVQLLKKKLSK